MGGIGLLAAFGAGIASFLSPCVAPLLPGYLTMLSGSSATAGATESRMRLFWPSLLFVLGFSLVFVTLGASASVFGDILDTHRRTMMRISGVVMILMGVVIIWGSRLPFMMRERRFHLSRQTFTPAETLLLGMAFGFGWTPCFGPILFARSGRAVPGGRAGARPVPARGQGAFAAWRDDRGCQWRSADRDWRPVRDRADVPARDRW
jgi:cytochrome c-type biogenesis protein